MARRMDEVEKSLENLEEEITCAVCHDHYQQPKLLPCLHFYCRECILQLVRAGINKRFTCPECRKVAFLSQGYVDRLRTAVFINRLKDHYTQLEKALGKVLVRSLKHLCQSKVKIFSLPVNPFLNTSTSQAVVNKMSEFVLCTATLCDSWPVRPDTQVDCHLNSLYNGSLIRCGVEAIGAGECCIHYTPTVRGRHELSISVDGQPVAGSPFPVLVCSPPTLLYKPVKVWDGFKNPYGIIVNSVGEIIVAEDEGDIVVMDRGGTRLRTINSSEHQFEHFPGVAVDSEDNIYFTEGTDRIFKFNKNCSKVEVHTVEQVKGPGHIDVAVVGDEVMVTERCNEGVIMVYDKELKYVRQIVGVNNDTLGAICPDSHQNVYVCDHFNSKLCIQVYSKDGELLRSIHSDEIDVGMVKFPRSICVAGQYVYVTSVDLCYFDSIFVFTTEGEYVTKFGNHESLGVCVDQDGFVYVTDCYHSKIYIY